MNKCQASMRIARMAFLLSLSLTAACATVNTAPVEEKAGLQAPEAGLQVESPAPVATPAAPTAAPVTPQASVTVTTISLVPGKITTRHKYVNVRPEPSTDKKPVAVLKGGKTVEVLGREGTWVKIRWTRGKKTLEGWVAGKFMETDAQSLKQRGPTVGPLFAPSSFPARFFPPNNGTCTWPRPSTTYSFPPHVPSFFIYLSFLKKTSKVPV